MGAFLNPIFWSGKKVLVTGHTGFKGGWLSLWLRELGAEVHGLSLPPEERSFYGATRLEEEVHDHFIDLRDEKAVSNMLSKLQPEAIFHFAAQAQVLEAYQDPLRTISTNVMGTVHLLESARHLRSLKAFVCVTTDKVYENQDGGRAFAEEDRLGVSDPYAASKTATEVLLRSYRESFFRQQNSPVLVAVRSGNAIGGGDWGSQRLVPGLIRCLQGGEILNIRSKGATRPWQHVLEPLGGYLILVERICKSSQKISDAYNFGPSEDQQVSVEEMARIFSEISGRQLALSFDSSKQKENLHLRLKSEKAEKELAWVPRWTLRQAIQMTWDWYQAEANGVDMKTYSKMQIKSWKSCGLQD